MVYSAYNFKLVKLSDPSKVRSSRPEVFCRKGVLRNFSKFTEKHLCQSLFLNKVLGLRPATLLKRTLWRKCFPVKFCEISKSTIFYRTPTVAASEKLAFFQIKQIGFRGAIETSFLTCLIFIQFEANLVQSNFGCKFCKIYK